MTDDEYATPAEVKILSEIYAEIVEAEANGQSVPPNVAARLYRGMSEHGLEEDAAEHRALLWGEADAGNERARAVLDLLADDPFWRRPDN